MNPTNDSGDASVRIGDMIAGKYRVEKVLGQGAMGVVVAAMHVELLERRAIKFMLPSMLGDAVGVERFLREARAAVRLKSQHVAKVQDVGRLESGAPYIVMEFLEGGDLKSVLDARGALPPDEAVRHVLQVCEALAEAHALGIVHRDLKPANLFVTRGAGGQPCIKVLDFGIAKVAGGLEGGGEMTTATDLLGTPLYMSPEQMRSTRDVDGRSDLWSVGIILYRMLTGRTPFSGSSVTEICSAVVADAPDPPSTIAMDLPPALEAAVMRCLEKNPAQRFATAAELAAAIAPFAVAWPRRAGAPSATPFVRATGESTQGSLRAVAAIAPAALSQAAPGQTTAIGASWTQGQRASPKKTSVGALFLAIVLTIGGLAAAILIARHFIVGRPVVLPAAAPPPSVSVEPPAASISLHPEPGSSAPPALTEPAPSASAPKDPPKASALAPRSIAPPHATPTKSDAFGDDRK